MKHFLLLLFFIPSTLVLGQLDVSGYNNLSKTEKAERVDSIAKTIQKDKAVSYRQKQHKFKELIKVSEEIECKKCEVNAYLRLFEYLSFNNQLDSANTVYTTLRKEYWDYLTSKQINFVSLIYGGNLDIQSKTDEAIKVFLNNIKEGYDVFYLAKNHHGIGSIYHKLGKEQLALEHLKKAQGYYLKTNNKNRSKNLSLIYHSIGVIYKHIPNTDSSLHYLQLSFSTFKTPNTLNSLAYLYMSKEHKDLNKAKYYIDELNKLKDSNYRWKRHVQTVYFLKSAWHIKMQQYDSAVMYSNKALEYAKNKGITTYIHQSYFLKIAGLLKDKGYLVDSLDAYQKKMRDVKVQNSTVDYETKYRTQEKEKELLLEQNKNLTTKTYIQYGVIATILLFSFLFFRYRNKQNKAKKKTQKAILDRQKVKNELAMKIATIKDKDSDIELLKKELKEAVESEQKTESILKTLEQNYISEKEWGDIILKFDSIHKNYLTDLKQKSPKITESDIRLSILIKLGYSNDAMKDILNISYGGVRKAKQRLNKKIGES